MQSLFARHIQDAASNSSFERHWGYADRVLPCTNDAGSCAYLDGVYGMHDTSMLYTFILWAVIGGLLLGFFALRLWKSSNRGETHQNSRLTASAYQRVLAGGGALYRRILLPESLVSYFGHVSRVQLLTLAILLAYLLIFSLAGIVYKTWFTPVKGHPSLHNTRTGLGGFADRVGALAYALTPLTVALSSRESILSLATGIVPCQFNFLHRWLGKIMLVQSILHTFGWTLIEGRFYQPQPRTWTDFVKQPYIIWGWVALGLFILLFILSLQRVIRLTGHEFFRKAHYILAGLYFGACWAHWDRLACWMIASLGIWGLDRGIRLLRTALLHIGYIDYRKGFGFRPAQSSIQYFDDDHGGIIRLDFDHNSDPWLIGQHYFLTFPSLSLWQSHPFTVASIPTTSALPHHTYIIRCRTGETKRLKSLTLEPQFTPTTPVILCGPYGKPLLNNQETTNILAIAGGTGVTLTLPLILAATSNLQHEHVSIDFVWIIRRSSNMEWIATELEQLNKRAEHGVSDLRVHIFITQEDSITPSKTSAGKSAQDAEITAVTSDKSLDTSSDKVQITSSIICYNRPLLSEIVNGFMENRAISSYRTRVIASGPASMGHDLRAAVASANDGGKVFRGDKRFDVSLDWDDRLG